MSIRILIALVLSCFTTAAVANLKMPHLNIDAASIPLCLPAIQQHVYCLKQEVRYYEEILNEEISADFMAKVDKCFADHKCHKPHNHRDLSSYLVGHEESYWHIFKQFWDSTPSSKRQCALKAVNDDFRPKFAECIAQTVPGFQVPILTDPVSLPEPVLLTLIKIAEYRVNVAKAANNCSSLDQVDRCIYNLRRTEFAPTCRIRQHCGVDDDDSSYSCYTICLTLTHTCRDIINRLREPACNCAAQGQKILRNQLHKFEKSGEHLMTAFLFGNSLTQSLQNCGLAVPLNPPKVKGISKDLPLLIAQYIDGFAVRDVTYCHKCSGQQI